MTDINTPEPMELLELPLASRAQQVLQQITEEHGIAIGDVIEIAISTGLPSVVKAAVCAPTK